jgi:hypothetical protein
MWAAKDPPEMRFHPPNPFQNLAFQGSTIVIPLASKSYAPAQPSHKTSSLEFYTEPSQRKGDVRHNARIELSQLLKAESKPRLTRVTEIFTGHAETLVPLLNESPLS